MDPNRPDPNRADPNRLHLNFGGLTGYNNDRNYSPSTEQRHFPTTPSAFPHSVFPNQGGQSQQVPSEYVAAQQSIQSPSQGYQQGQGYFTSPQPQQQQYNQGQYPQGQYQQQNTYTQQAYQQRQPGMNGINPNDPNNGLARQFSNQNLGGGQRQQQNNYPPRQPSPNPPRLRQHMTAPQQSYGNHLAPTAPGQSPGAQQEDEPPEKNPEKYSHNIAKRGQLVHGRIEDFFKSNITRARDRNQRAKQLDEECRDPRNSEFAKRQKIRSTWDAEQQYLRFLRTAESPDNYNKIKTIGKGAFGEVRLVQRKNDGKIFALKSLVKTEMFKKDQLAHVRAERDILSEAVTPWIVTLYTTFQDPAYLYMLMEFLPGGDLMTMLIKYEVFAEDVTRFYMAELISAIEAVHALGYVHRDIKPDNILLDANGHIKLTDFGLSTGFHPKHAGEFYADLFKTPKAEFKKDNRRSVNFDQLNLTLKDYEGTKSAVNDWRKSRRVLAYSTVGTPDYIAPEIFSQKGYAFSCDWWSVGAIMFECLIGWPPFCAEDQHDTYRKIMNWRETLFFPPEVKLPQRSEHLVRSLLCDAEYRLGTMGGSKGATEIKAHPFFHGTPWNNLRRIQAPFRPELKSNLDTTYFPTDEIDQVDHSATQKHQIAQLGEEHMAEMNMPFIGYTFKRFEGMKS